MNMNERWMYPTVKYQVFEGGELIGFYDSLNAAKAKCEQLSSFCHNEILPVSKAFLQEFYPEELE